MGEMMKRLIEETAKLPPEEQEQWAATWLQELEDELGWERRFREHPEVLERLAEEARAEHKAGRTVPLDFDKRR
jgi:hypothetical protein